MNKPSIRKRIILSLLRILAGVALLAVLIWWVVAQPTWRSSPPSTLSVEPARLRAHVTMLAETLAPRDSLHVENLDKCAAYIAAQFTQAGAAVEDQPFQVQGKTYRNVIGRFGVGKGGKLVIGAHYDACGEVPAADDNASGTAALLELAVLLGKNPPAQEIELVAYTLEEPPFFATESMGSAFHARSLAAKKETVRGVIVLEMVGFFKDTWGSQSYPTLLLHALYPSRGNFITVASRFDQGDWIKSIKAGMKGATPLPVYSLRAPAIVPGIDFSDHMNYWPYNYPAVMITDTAFYRNRSYHTSADTVASLDYRRMADVVLAVHAATQACHDGRMSPP